MKGITLIGMSGSGKSTIGALLAKKLNWKFIDLDPLILEKQGAHHHQVMLRLGEEGFKKLEEIYALELNLADRVFAPSGSLIYSSSAMEKIKNDSLVLYLQVDAQTVERRLGGRLHKNGIVGLKEKGLHKVMEERARLYEAYADHTFVSGAQGKDAMAEAILARLGMHR